MNGGKITENNTILMENASIASIYFCLCMFYCSSVFIWSYCGLLIVSCHQNVLNMTKSILNGIKFRPVWLNCQLISFNSLQCSAMQSVVNFHLWVFTCSSWAQCLQSKNKNRAQQKCGIWWAFQISIKLRASIHESMSICDMLLHASMKLQAYTGMHRVVAHRIR